MIQTKLNQSKQYPDEIEAIPDFRIGLHVWQVMTGILHLQYIIIYSNCEKTSFYFYFRENNDTLLDTHRYQTICPDQWLTAKLITTNTKLIRSGELHLAGDNEPHKTFLCWINKLDFNSIVP